MNLADLSPYRSLILGEFRTRAKNLVVAVNGLLDDLVGVLGLDDNDEALKLLFKSPATKSAQLTAGFPHFTEKRQASWTSNPEVLDTLNHLVLVCAYKQLIAIFLSATTFRSRVIRRFDEADGQGLGMLQRISPTRLNAAFVQGEARTLWLSGIHRRTPAKADSKILSGIDLRDALNPLDDQTYNFTAARCILDFAQHRTTVGSAPRRFWGHCVIALRGLCMD